MKKHLSKLFYITGISALLFTACRKDDYRQPVPQISETSDADDFNIAVVSSTYIVILKDDLFPDLSSIQGYEQRSERMAAEAKNILRRSGAPDIVPERVYHSSVKGFSCRLSPSQLEKLKADESVDFIEQDQIITLGPQNGNVSSGASQTVPYGITRVGWTTSVDGTGKVAWIIDTGVDLTHPDLNVDAVHSKSFLLSGKNFSSPNDENGHGTHVSGTIAAKNNSIGVVGVAPNATLVAVRVLNQNGSGTISGVINGVDYVAATAKAGDVANMSLGGGASSSLDKVVASAAKMGIYFAIAAGNSSDDANKYSPARVNGTNIYTVSAMDSKDIWAYFSNYGNPPIDYCAPGVSVLSTWKGGKYNTISGTSMATPHVAGVLLMTNGAPKAGGKVINDPDGNADIIVHL